MNSRALGATHVLAWPTAEVAVMGSLAAVRVLHRKRIAAASESDRAALEAELVADHERSAGGLSRAMQLGVVDAVIDPAHTRSALASLLAAAPTRRGRHTNIPL
jgi:acetyl-CoA/propionyl-CoA carboxylase carboxyl transferase subunit